MTNCNPECSVDCSWVFGRVRVYHAFTTGTTVEWDIHPNFTDPLPHSFQLQVGSTGLNNALDWENVGDPVVDTYQATDTVQRVWGKTPWTHYRVELTTDKGTYYSAAEPITGVMDKYRWRLARKIISEELLRFRKKVGVKGYLLKRRNYGEPCSCLDFQTKEVRNPQHEECFGTGIVGGYFAAHQCSYVEFMLKSTRTHLDDTRGTVVEPGVAQARMLAIPQINSYDIWMEATSGLRWRIHTIQNVVEMVGIPLVHMVELRLIEFGDVAYKIPVL